MHALQGFQPLLITVLAVRHLLVVKVLLEHGANPWSANHQVCIATLLLNVVAYLLLHVCIGHTGHLYQSSAT